MPELWIPSGTGRAEFIERKSRFIGEGCRVDTPEGARARIKELKLQHPRSRHVAWAYVLGTDRGLRGLSDDGEPRGTAGRPIIDPIIGAGLTNTLVTVVRYFGGVKLGTGGLTSAYGRAGKEALAAMPVIRLIVRKRIELKLDYSLYDYVLRLSKEAEAVIINVKFDSAVTVELDVPETQLDDFSRRIGDAGSGTVLIRGLQEKGD
jgi:uncharacterized YigZ family protein